MDEILRALEEEFMRLASLFASLPPTAIDELYQEVASGRPKVEETVQSLAIQAAAAFIAKSKEVPLHTSDAAVATAQINFELGNQSSHHARWNPTVPSTKNILDTHPKHARLDATRPRASAERSVVVRHSSRSAIELYPFDDSYMKLLRHGDRATQDHFVAYFGKLLRIKLLGRKLPAHVIADVQQETFLRVLLAVRTGDVRQPDRLGAYVNSVCNNVLLEHYRRQSREQHEELDSVDVPDVAADLEARIIADERTQSVHATMRQLSGRDRAALWAILLDRDKEEVCRELDVNRRDLRLLTHRAIGVFRARFKEEERAGGIRLRGEKMNDQ